MTAGAKRHPSAHSAHAHTPRTHTLRARTHAHTHTHPAAQRPLSDLLGVMALETGLVMQNLQQVRQCVRACVRACMMGACA